MRRGISSIFRIIVLLAIMATVVQPASARYWFVSYRNVDVKYSCGHSIVVVTEQDLLSRNMWYGIYIDKRIVDSFEVKAQNYSRFLSTVEEFLKGSAMQMGCMPAYIHCLITLGDDTLFVIAGPCVLLDDSWAVITCPIAAACILKAIPPLQMSKTGVLNVIVKDDSKNRLEGAAVYLNGNYQGKTNYNGFFKIKNVKEGYHTVKASKKGYKSDSKRGYLKAGKTATAKLVLEKKAKKPFLNSTSASVPSTSVFFQVGEYLRARLFLLNSEQLEGVFSLIYEMKKENFFSDFYSASVAPTSEEWIL